MQELAGGSSCSFGEREISMNGKFARAFWPLLLLVDLLVIGGGIFLLFSGRDYSVAQKQNSSLIGLSYMTMNNEFYKIMSE